MSDSGFASLACGIQLHYQIEGDEFKPYLLLSHGNGSDLTSFDDIVPFFLENFQVIRWDHRGHGQSDKPISEDSEELLNLYSINRLAMDISELIDALSLNKEKSLFLYGHSMGGMISLQFVCNYPDILTGLAVASTSPNNDNPTMHNMLENYQSGVTVMNEAAFRATAAAGYSQAYVKNHPDIIDHSVQNKLTVGPSILLALLENMVLHYNVDSQLPNCNVPMLILHGTSDLTIPVSYGEQIHNLVPNSKLILLPKLSHGINLEIPQKVSKFITDFFWELDNT